MTNETAITVLGLASIYGLWCRATRWPELAKVVLGVWVLVALIGSVVTKIYFTPEQLSSFGIWMGFSLPIIALPFVFTTEGWLTHQRLHEKLKEAERMSDETR